MYIYADESGNEGRNIFGPQRAYLLGALISNSNIDEKLTQLFAEELARQKAVDPKINRIHAKNMLPKDVEALGQKLLENLDDVNWDFHLTIMDKEYLSVLKFVDTIFDSGENSAARGLWYMNSFLRHTLCCFVSDCMLHDTRVRFWDSYLKDDYDGLANAAGEVLINVDSAIVDQRLKQVTRDAIIGFISDPRQVSLSATVKRKSYRAHTPNMISFSTLIHTINNHCIENDVTVKSFIHDTQSEFTSSMKEYIELFSAMSIQFNEFDVPEVRALKDWKAKFEIKSSSESPGLQACDVFLWMIQRMQKVKEYDIPESLSDKVIPYSFSYNSSACIAEEGYLNNMSRDLSQEQIEIGKARVRNSERAFQSRNKGKLFD